MVMPLVSAGYMMKRIGVEADVAAAGARITEVVAVAVPRGEERAHVATTGLRGTTGESPTEKNS
jgi:hypothetical protein